MRYLPTLLAFMLFAPSASTAEPAVIRSAKSGPWSAGATWEGGAVPGSGARVLVRAGHEVRYDAKSDAVIRGINVAGSLVFASDVGSPGTELEFAL